MLCLTALFEENSEPREPVESLWAKERHLSAWCVCEVREWIWLWNIGPVLLPSDSVDQRLSSKLLIVNRFWCFRFWLYITGLVGLTSEVYFKWKYLDRVFARYDIRNCRSLIRFLFVVDELQVVALRDLISSTVVSARSLRLTIILAALNSGTCFLHVTSSL